MSALPVHLQAPGSKTWLEEVGVAVLYSTLLPLLVATAFSLSCAVGTKADEVDVAEAGASEHSAPLSAVALKIFQWK